jgi:hypothetical protein
VGDVENGRPPAHDGRYYIRCCPPKVLIKLAGFIL